MAPLGVLLALPFVAATIVAGVVGAKEPTVGETLWTVAAAVLFALAVAALLVHPDPSSWRNGSSSGSDSDIRTTTEALISALITALAAAASGVALARASRTDG